MSPTRRERALLLDVEDGPCVVDDHVSATALVGRGWLRVGREGWYLTPAGELALRTPRARA